MGAALGKDFAKEVLPALGPDWGLCVLAPPPQDMFRYMYAEMTPQLIEQEAALLASLQHQGEGHGTAHAR